MLDSLVPNVVAAFCLVLPLLLPDNSVLTSGFSCHKIEIINGGLGRHRYDRRRRYVGLRKVSVFNAFETQAEEGSNELGAWVPIGSKSAFAGLGPTRVKLMGMEFVVWESSSDGPKSKIKWYSRSQGARKEAQWSVLSDACPHRKAPLSLGRVVPETGCIECPYHGWQFETDGEVSHIPQLEGNISSSLSPSLTRKASSQSYPVHLTGDLIWAFLPSSIHGESFPRRMLPEDYYFGLQDDMAKGAKYHVQEMPASMDFLVENAVDPAHFPFAHHSVISSRQDASPLPMEIQASNFTHVEVATSYERNGIFRERVYAFQRPCLMYTKQKDLDTLEFNRGIVVFVVPIQEGRSRLFTSLGSSKLSKLPLPDWIIHFLARRLFEGDMLIHDAERAARDGSDQLDYVLPTSSDKSVAAFRKWFRTHGFSKAPPHTFGPASPANLNVLSRQEQLHPWSVHTKTCSKCRAALVRARKIQYWGLVVGFASSMLAVRKNHLLSVAFAVGGFLVNAAAKRLVENLEGSTHPSDTDDHLIPNGN